jgi:hypothetical protein
MKTEGATPGNSISQFILKNPGCYGACPQLTVTHSCYNTTSCLIAASARDTESNLPMYFHDLDVDRLIRSFIVYLEAGSSQYSAR